MSMDSNSAAGKSKESKPLLVFDGDCTFCRYWVDYWIKITGDKVNYEPYQNVADDYQQISIEEYQRAVQYITPEGHVSSGAEASFKTINNGDGYGIWLWLYNWLPGFSWLAEWGYSFVSKRRNLFFGISKFLYGKQPEPPRYDLITGLFLRIFGIILLIAFSSFTMQASGLIGDQGIVPLNELITAASNQLGWERFWYLPMVFWISSANWFIYLACFAGILSSALIIFNFYTRTNLIISYALYLSLIYAGQLFMSFQWDLLLVETALIAFFLVRFRTLGIWLLRWLTFRFMFAAGLVKVFSGDPSWWNLTALNFHLFTQPLPTPLAYYVDKLPQFFLSTATLITLIIELFLVFLIFTPRRLRFWSAYAILLLQVGIMLTGNYNFFNITTILLTLSLFDDAAIRHLMPATLAAKLQQKMPAGKPYKFTSVLAILFAVVTISLSLIQFSARFTGFAPEPLVAFNRFFAPLRMVSTYGPFAVMTKQRYEIIFEGSYDGRTWREYEFKYKPGDIYRRAMWNIPFQPRLDWQMWFAALGPARNSPWVGRFIQRLLENSEPVVGLLKTNPFSDNPPIYVRALFYDYSFSTRAQRAEDGIYWDRWLEGVYFPQSSLRSTATETTVVDEPGVNTESDIETIVDEPDSAVNGDDAATANTASTDATTATQQNNSQ